MIKATLVTIHGFWSSPVTWERLRASWSADEQLRGLRIHAFGYSSPKRPRLPFSVTRVPDYDDIAQMLASEYAVSLAEEANIAIVTHSQGGLILQRFLIWMLNQGRGQELARIRTIIMLACPNGGSEYLQSIRHILGFGRHAQAGHLEVLNRQVADTQRAVLQHIVNATGIDEHQCRIPFHVYAGSSDKVVTAASAQGSFPGASTLAGNHFSILDPASPGNRTAETVKYHLITDFSASPPPPNCAATGADIAPYSIGAIYRSAGADRSGWREYREQVAEIAPRGGLLDRDAELRHMAEFCAGPESYWWWRAGAWAGKSALMSWFTLNSPPQVVVVPFFITARYGSQDDSLAFTMTVLRQLEELSGESLPEHLPAGTSATEVEVSGF
jgi:hypothetical protein